jgi:hypothetical protein
MANPISSTWVAAFLLSFGSPPVRYVRELMFDLPID